MRIHESVGAANERRYLRGGFVNRQHSPRFAEFRTPRTLKRLASLVVAYVCLHPDLARVRASSRVRGVQNSATPTTCSYTPHICVCVCVCVCALRASPRVHLCGRGGEAGFRGCGVRSRSKHLRRAVRRGGARFNPHRTPPKHRYRTSTPS